MPKKVRPLPALPALPALDVEGFLKAWTPTTRTRHYASDSALFRQGSPANQVFYLKEGSVKLVVLSSTGKEGVVAMLGPGDFLGEGSLAGQLKRMATASAISPTVALCVGKDDMLRALHEHPEFSDRFIAHMLARNIRIEEDLVDQLFNSSEKRLARALLLLARYGKEDGGARLMPKVSQETLAEIVGTTRSRVNFFMNKFRKLGFIDYNGRLTVHSSLLSVVLHD